MPTKTELQHKIRQLDEELAAEKKRPKGTHIENCSIDMSEPDEVKLAVARAVLEGMKALQTLGGNNYGIYIGPESYGMDA
jgi:hypothetical protein